MGYFGYELLVTLTPEQVAERRISLNNHANLAQLSQILVLLLVLLARYDILTLDSSIIGSTEASTNITKHNPFSDSGTQAWKSRILRLTRIWKWRLGEESVPGYGTVGQWIGGISWSFWLVFLCLHSTTPDYMHLTKRFGIVAASQLPLHYLLAMKSFYSPLQRIFKTSHETLNLIHQVLGRVILMFLMLHAAFYLNFFLRLGVLAKRARDLDVKMGLASITVLLVLGTTSMGIIRRASYRLFYSIHVIGSLLILVLLFFHVMHIRLFIYECGAIQLTNVFLRYYHTKEVLAELKPIPETNLVQISSRTRWGSSLWTPGQHVYLRLSNSGIWSYLRSNPFTISSLPEDNGVVLVARVQDGNTQQLASIAANSITDEAPTKVQLYLEGPYGHSRYFVDFTRFDKILLFAGGIGATYIIPVWKYITLQRFRGPKHDQQCHFVWTVRTIADTTWAHELLQRLPDESYENDELDLHVTAKGQDFGPSTYRSTELKQRALSSQEQAAIDAGFVTKYGRPDVKRIVDELFASHSGRVAVLACGPRPMMRELRIHIGKWVVSGREVYWHGEEFGL